MLYQIIKLKKPYDSTNKETTESFILEEISTQENEQYNGFVRRRSLEDAKKTLKDCNAYSPNKMVIVSIDDTLQDYCIKEFHYLHDEIFNEKKLIDEEIEIEFTSEKVSPKRNILLEKYLSRLEKAIADLKKYSQHTCEAKAQTAKKISDELSKNFSNLKEKPNKKNYSILKESFNAIKLNNDLTKHRTQYKNILATIGAYITIIGGLIDIGMRIYSRIATGHSQGLFSKTNGQKKLENIEAKLNYLEKIYKK
ncbi:MAG: hypothetical protein LEGION0398_MBIBDBAK_01183 [Legionellaceae bacterium]